MSNELIHYPIYKHYRGELFSSSPPPLRVRDSSDGIATGYGLDGPEIESQWRQDFSHASIPALGPTQPPVQWVRVFPGGKAAWT
jgi:hypothetical protein